VWDNGAIQVAKKFRASWAFFARVSAKSLRIETFGRAA